MKRTILYFTFLVYLFTSCEEIYKADIDYANGQLVVESLVTNELSKNFVRLTKTRNFNDEVSVVGISGATVELIENKTRVIRTTESSTGYYTFTTVPESGSSYHLRITVKGDLYESREVTMPPLPTFTNLNTVKITKTVFVASGESNPLPYEKQYREIHVDIPVTPELSHYRFDLRSVFEWSWDSTFIPPSPTGIPTGYGFYAYSQTEKFVLAAPQNFSQAGNIQKFPLFQISYNAIDYLYSDTLKPKGWILVIEQYGTSKESYEYHENLNNQFSAVGSLFDPVQNQVHGNIICKSDPNKVVYGFFDLNSYQQYRYYFELPTPPIPLILRQIYRFPTIPPGFKWIMRTSRDSQGTQPPLSPPDWWE